MSVSVEEESNIEHDIDNDIENDQEKIYQCYACTKTFKNISEFRYECMCIPGKDQNSMGVCKNCENVPENEFKIPIPPGHHMSKLHDLTSEYKTHCDLINKSAPGWSCMSCENGSEIYYYYENTENLPPKEFGYKTCFDQDYRQSHKRTFEIPIFQGKMCDCCESF